MRNPSCVKCLKPLLLAPLDQVEKLACLYVHTGRTYRAGLFLLDVMLLLLLLSFSESTMLLMLLVPQVLDLVGEFLFRLDFGGFSVVVFDPQFTKPGPATSADAIAGSLRSSATIFSARARGF